MLVSVAAGPRGQAAIHRYVARYPSQIVLAVTPTSLINFGEAVNFPLLFGAMLAVFGAATLLHLLVVSVSRRRREVGLLKVVGFVRSQIAATVAWQATTLALIGMVIGVPLGVAVGKVVWHDFANNLGAVPVSVVPVWLIAIVAVGVLVVTNLIAAGPAVAATRSKPADLLRVARGREV
jgi:ABC-type antimicrobial peptide transport system permease subunit